MNENGPPVTTPPTGLKRGSTFNRSSVLTAQYRRTPPATNNSQTQINELYQKYFGRIANAEELTYWKTQPLSGLESQLKTDYESASSHTYDGSAIISGGNYTQKDKQRIDTMFSQYGFTPTSSDYSYWSNPNKTNSTGNLETNLSQRFLNVNNISYQDKQRVDQAFSQYGFTPTADDYKYWADSSKTNSTGNLEANLKNRAGNTGQQPSTTAGEQAAAPTDQRIKTVSNPDAYDKAFFEDSGKGAFITFQTDPDGNGELTTGTIYHVDPETSNIFPILNEQALINNFDDYNSLGELLKSGKVVSVPTSWIKEGYPLFGYVLQDAQYGYTANPTERKMPPTDTGTDSLSLRYGKDLDATHQEQIFRENVAGFLKWIKSNPDSGISSSTIDEIIKDPSALALYTSALTYGGYTQADIYRDLKRRDLVAQGKSEYTNTTIIDPGVQADQFFSTGNGVTIRNNSAFNPPDTIGGLDTSGLDAKWSSLSTEFYDAFTPTIEWDSEEGKAKINEIQSAYHDIIVQYMEAGTEREQALAEQNYNDFRDKLGKSYNIQLGNNALTAWDNINNLQSTISGQGLSGTGMEKEATDKYLQRVRRGDEQLRTEKLDKEDESKKEYYMKYATSEEIAALSDADKVKFGLKPAEAVSKEQWIADFKAKYPNEDADYAELYYNTMFDENGNYKSELYENLAKNKFMVSEGTSFGSVPQGKKDYQEELAKERYDDEIKPEIESTTRKYAEVKEAMNQPIGSTIETGSTNSSNSGNTSSLSNIMRIYYNKNKDNYMDIPSVDLEYWKKQPGWNTTTS